MAELRPYPFAALVRRALRDLETANTVFHLPRRRFFLGDPERDLSVRLHGHRVGSTLGPAAGPHTQMAQNIALSWLAGCRVFELKTVQILDELSIPRPCIDMENVGFNVEWSQELKLQESLEEYVKASMLIEIMAASGQLEIAPGFADFVFDMSVGYDLKGIQSESVQSFIAQMLDCTGLVDRFRKQIPAEFARYRDLDFKTRLSDTLTLSTFHGCPPDEIEGIVQHLLEANGLHCTVKLNPTLLGRAELDRLLHEVMGYRDCIVPDKAFAEDPTWDQATAFVERLGASAQSLGLGFGVKFTNTLIVENHKSFFPQTEKHMYLSGQPLHVLAMQLVGKFRGQFGDRWPVSFSAGIDKKNYPDAVAMGLVPVTVCSDLLRPGGYGRVLDYYKELERRMKAHGVTRAGDFALVSHGHGAAALDAAGELDPTRRAACLATLKGDGIPRAAAGDELYASWVSHAQLLNTADYVSALEEDPRYHAAQNAKLPKKIGSRLVLFDCITCDKCIPVCPNDANFRLELPIGEVPVIKLRRTGSGWETEEAAAVSIGKKHQIANFADFCNECGNCDIFCPEDGGPYVIKPRFFGSLEDWELFADQNGFHIARQGDAVLVAARIGLRGYHLSTQGARSTFSGEGFCVTFDDADPTGTIEGEADGVVDLTCYRIMTLLRDAVLASGTATYAGATLEG